MQRMLRLLAPLSLLALVVGCGPTVEDRLVGKWNGTFEANQVSVPGLAQFDLELKADKTVSTKLSALGAEHTSTGTWELKSSDEKQAVIVTKEGDKTHEKVLTLDEDFLKGTGGFSMPLPGQEKLGKLKFKRGT